MKKAFGACCILLLGSMIALADQQTRAVQERLKDLGFYYGEVDGQGGSETEAAIRRYQIRNGLKVTGTLNDETLTSLQPRASGSTPPPAVRERVFESDEEFLRRENQQENSVTPSTPRPMPEPEPEFEEEPQDEPPEPVRRFDEEPQLEAVPAMPYEEIFARTPYESAPYEVQRSTLRRAQSLLRYEGFYRGGVDGVPGPGTERALVQFQHDAGLPPTGRLDIHTLNVMGLLPGRPAWPPRGYYHRYAPRPLRGIWID